MKRFTIIPPMALLLTMGAGVALAQEPEDRSTLLAQAFYKKLGNLFNPKPAPGTKATSYLVLANPGVRFDPSLDPKGRVDDEHLISLVLNDALAPSLVYTPGSRTVPDVYKYIFAFKEQPTARPSVADTDLLEKMTALVGENSQKYQSYLARQAKYMDAVLAYEGAKEAGKTGSSLQVYAMARQNAMDQWNGQGYRREIESAFEKILELQAKDPGFWWKSLRDRFEQQKVVSSDGVTEFYRTLTYPRYEDWKLDAGWTTVTLSDDELESKSEYRHIDAGAGASYRRWWGGGSASASVQQTDFNSRLTKKGLSITLQVKGVTIYRPWMDALVFRSRAWRLNKNQGVDIISTGDPDKPGKGLMPLMPVRLLLARKILFKGNWSQEDRALFERHIRSSASGGWGPFSFHAHYNQDDKKESFTAKVSTAGIECPDTQILGFVCDIIPKCPSPDSKFTFVAASEKL